MRTTIDRSGRLVIPKVLRERLHLVDGGEVEVTHRRGVIEIAPIPADVDLVETEAGPVAQTRTPLPPLTDAEVLATIDDGRR